MKPPKPKIILVTGGTGAGKTTYSQKLCKEIGALRFSIDDWMTGLFWMDAPEGGATFDWYSCELHWIDIPQDIRWERVQGRNREKGESYTMDVTREMFDFMEGEWEMPSKANWDNSNPIVIIRD